MNNQAIIASVTTQIIEQLKAGDGQLAPQVEQLVLDFNQHIAHIVRHIFAQQHADV